jgi:hypothetical protein
MNIVVIGAQKAGTSWLYSMLEQQPSVGTAFQKEVRYFDNLCNPAFDFRNYRNHVRTKVGDRMRMSPDFRRYMNRCLNPGTAFTDEWYRRSFTDKPENRAKLDRGDKMIFVDASPNYMTIPETGVAHMAKVLGDIAPILLVRDPFRRMVSGTSMEIFKHPQRFASDIQIREFIVRAQVPKGSYSKAIPLYRKFFSQLTIVPFGMIHRAPDSILRKIEDSYGLENIEYDRIGKKFGSKSGQIALSEEIQDVMKSACEPEYEYLRKEFGADFLSEI